MNEQLRKCANCPNMLPPQAKFCTKCGEEVKAAPPPPPPRDTKVEDSSKDSGKLRKPDDTRMKRPVLGALVLSFVFAAGLLVMKMIGGGTTNKPEPPKKTEITTASPEKPPSEKPTSTGGQKPPQPALSTIETRTLDEAEQAIAASRKIAKHIDPLLDLLKTGSPAAHDRAKTLLLGLSKNHALMAKLGDANIGVLLAGLANSGDNDLVAAGRDTRQPPSDVQPTTSGTGSLTIGDTANLVKIDGKAVPNFYAPGRTHVPAGAHTVALYKTANDATPFRTVKVEVGPSATVKIPRSKESVN